MQDRDTPEANGPSGQGSAGDAAVAVPESARTRWTPKPEQILILESIFNSGMVNPPKDETVRIRKLLEKFGSVGDANVFYWFQNQRSRSRRRQRQMRGEGLAGGDQRVVSGVPAATVGATPPETTSRSTSSTTTLSSNSSRGGFMISASAAAASSTATGCCSSGLIAHDGAEDLFSISRQMGFRENGDQAPIYSSPPDFLGGPSIHHHSGFITVFINGIPQEVPRGPFYLRAVFGQDVMLVHSSGELVPKNDYGLLFQGLLAGDSYFLVP